MAGSIKVRFLPVWDKEVGLLARKSFFEKHIQSVPADGQDDAARPLSVMTSGILWIWRRFTVVVLAPMGLIPVKKGICL